MPGEFLQWMWLPEIDAYTLRTSQPAISSASSTARWIDCTVESMSTTTPLRSPRDSCEPMPITSIGSPGAYSPTNAVTLEVPISRPTISDLSPLRFMYLLALFRSLPRLRERVGVGLLPASDSAGRRPSAGQPS